MKVETKWIIICAIGGGLMLLGTASGLILFSILIGLYTQYGTTAISDAVGPNFAATLTIIITIVLFVMAGGGISVIIGSILIFMHLYKLGKMIIALGSGMGVIGVIMFLIWEASFINPVVTWVDFMFFLLSLLVNFYFLGVIMALIGRKKMKKLTDEEYGEKLLKQATSKHDKQFDKLYDKINCPVCNTENPKVNQFCRKCGTELSYSLDEHL